MLGCGYLGISFARMQELRTRRLELLEQMFRQLEFNIVFLLKTFPEAIKSVAESYKGMLGRLFQKVADRMLKNPNQPPEEAFRFALEDGEGNCLKEKEKEILEEFFRHMGKGDRERVGDGIRMTMAKLKALREQVERDRKKDEKLWRSMGFLSGVFIVLLLM